MGAWPLSGHGAPAAWSRADEAAVLASGDPLRVL